MNRSRAVSVQALFAAIVVVLDTVPIIPGFYSGVWDSWLFLLSPLVGILLGPFSGAATVALGTALGHLIYFRDPFELLFMAGAPLGAAMAGFVYQRRWRPVLGIYSMMLAAYFVYPVSWTLPLWGIWDVLVGFGVVVLFSLLVRGGLRTGRPLQKRWLMLGLASVVGLESDILLRICILVPGQTYWLFYGLTPEMLSLLWLGAGLVTPIKVVLAVLVSITLGVPTLSILEKESNPIVVQRDE